MDHISNLITSIHNAEMVKKTQLSVPNTKLSRSVLEVLKTQGFVSSFMESDSLIIITLAQPVMVHHYKRISKPGRRVYRTSGTLPVVRRGFGTVIVSTSKGVMSGKEAHKMKIGGEVLCEIY